MRACVCAFVCVAQDDIDPITAALTSAAARARSERLLEEEGLLDPLMIALNQVARTQSSVHAHMDDGDDDVIMLALSEVAATALAGA